MITSKGKAILAKYLVAETPSYASYIAVGCGAKPIDASLPFTAQQRLDFYSKTEMDLEMLRVPITSKGFIVENDSVEITNAIYSTGVITYTTLTPHPYTVGQKITVSGSTVDDYNVTDEMIIPTGIGANTFSVMKTILVPPATYQPGAVAHAKVSKIVLTGQMPTTERYEISEIAIYPAISNPDAPDNDSRIVYDFSSTAQNKWEYHDGATVSAIPLELNAIDQKSETNTIDYENILGKAFYAKSSNSALNNVVRSSRYERPRYLEESLFVRGDISELSVVGDEIITTDQPHVHVSTSLGFLDKSSPKDILKLAFSVISRENDQDNINPPKNIKIVVEFSSDDSGANDNYAKWDIEVVNIGSIPSTTNYTVADLESNRYVVVSAKRENLSYSTNFSWGAVRFAKIYATVSNDLGVAQDSFYIGLDAIRFENITSENPLYGMVGYSIMKNTNALTITKDSNKSGFIEFRYSVDVG